MIDSTKEYIAVYAKVGAGTKVICPVKIGDKADATLIAAAPELLAALRLTQRTCVGTFARGWTVSLTGHEMDAIRAALAKTEGQ
jgi:hypothetical protein